MSQEINIHDYLESIGAEPPPVDKRELEKAKKSIVWCDSIEEAVEAIIKLDAQAMAPMPGRSVICPKCGHTWWVT